VKKTLNEIGILLGGDVKGDGGFLSRESGASMRPAKEI
jgi:hypothetical protein